jgi:hypothetical protein
MKQLIRKHISIVKIFVLSIPLLLNSMCFAQSDDSKGTDFWLMFNTNYIGEPALTLFITSSVNTSGTVSAPGLGFSIPFTVTAYSVTSVSIPVQAGIHLNDAIGNNGIHVTALQDVSVYGLNRIPFTTDAYLGLPTDALGTDYIILSYGSGLRSQFGLVGTVDGTIVTITPSVSVLSHNPGVPFTITLNQGQTFELGGGTDLTGTIISATNPVGVMGSNQCANIPPGAAFCDHICEMLSPITTWGKKFVTVPLKSRINGDTWRFLASEDNTVITINSVAQPPINKGNFIEQIIAAQSIIESDKPILVAQYSNGSSFSGNPGDPFMMLIPPYEQFLGDYTLTSVAGFIAHYINIVAPNAIVGTLTLDGVVVPASSFTPISSSGFSGAQLSVTEGSHTLAATLPFGAFQYGFNNDDSYGYPGGQSFSPIAIVSSLVLTPESGTAKINTEQCFDAVVKDQNDLPLEGIRVDFSITGVNAVSSGFTFTNANGIAHFCYTGTAEGSDNITASVGTISDASTFNWTDVCSVTVAAKKFYDLNADGLDNDNIPVEGWTITLGGTDENNNTVGPINQSTDAGGTTNFTEVALGTYIVSEGTQPNWIHTTTSSVNLNLTECTNPAELKFGNVCLGTGTTISGTFGVGYWTNKNGQSLVNGLYLCELNSLCLRNATGTNFDPVAGCPTPNNSQVSAGKTNLKSWLHNATATNMSYMLSAQLATMKLNVLKGYVDGTKLIYAPGTGSANAAGFATVNAIMTEANTILCANPVINAASLLRPIAEAVKNALDKANNNLNYIQAQPCGLIQSTNAARIETQGTNEIISPEIFNARVLANPSSTSFTVITKSDSKQPISLRVYDELGRVVETRRGIPANNVLSIGYKYKSGLYYAEIMQGSKKQIIKLVKGSQ